MEKCPWDAQVNLVLTDNEEIKRVNTEFRGIERATDVLSFPMLPFETPADYSVAEDDESCFDLDSGELLLGDIMISAERAAAQAEEYGHSVKEGILLPGCTQYATPSGIRSHDSGGSRRYGSTPGEGTGGTWNYPLNFFVHDPIAGEAFAVCRE